MDRSRREFVVAGGMALPAAALAAESAAAQGPTVLTPRSVKPVVVASANGHEFRNGGPRTCVEEAFHRLTAGEDVLDALIAGVNLNELDPLDDSVGYGGLPNADGVVQLDASCMHGPRRRAGAVAAIEGVRTPSLVARAVMLHTDHHLLVGRDAQRFARQMGFPVEEDLNTENSRRKWLEWRRKVDPEHWLDPARRPAAGEVPAGTPTTRVEDEHVYGTINCDGLSPRGELAGVTTTSGLAWKVPGRVGDSPILGAGLYVDGAVGAAGSTGRGEANLFGLSSFLVVELLRQGRHPKDAALEALRRVKENTVEKRLLNARGLPNFNLKIYVVDRSGRHAGAALYGGPTQKYAVCTENGPELPLLEPLLEGTATP